MTLLYINSSISFFFLFFYSSCFMSIYNSMGYDRFKHLYIQNFSLAWRFLIFYFPVILSHLTYNIREFFPSNFDLNWFSQFVSNFSFIQSSFCFYSISHFFTSSFLLIFVNFKNLIKKLSVFLFAKNSASFFLSIYFCLQILLLYKFLRSFCYSFFYFLHLVYRHSINCFVWSY